MCDKPTLDSQWRKHKQPGAPRGRSGAGAMREISMPGLPGQARKMAEPVQQDGAEQRGRRDQGHLELTSTPAAGFGAARIWDITSTVPNLTRGPRKINLSIWLVVVAQR